MPTWLGTLIVLALVGAMVFLLVRSLIREKRRGSCCGGCARCKMQCPTRKNSVGNVEQKKK